jgi:hypothetical protein
VAEADGFQASLFPSEAALMQRLQTKNYAFPVSKSVAIF